MPYDSPNSPRNTDAPRTWKDALIVKLFDKGVEYMQLKK